MAEPIVSRPGEGELLVRNNRSLLVRVDHPGLSVIEISFERTFGVPHHTHDDHVDAFYVLEGHVEFLTEGESIIGGPGTFVAVPPNTVHGFANPGPGPARILNFHAPDAGFVASLQR
jgi:quercetin dioxygenase-like cupin family protein